MTKRTFKRGNLIVDVDRSQVYPDDPGAGCPVLVSYANSQGKIMDSGSYNCVLDIGEFMNGRILTSGEVEWLVNLERIIEDFLAPKVQS